MEEIELTYLNQHGPIWGFGVLGLGGPGLYYRDRDRADSLDLIGSWQLGGGGPRARFFLVLLVIELMQPET